MAEPRDTFNATAPEVPMLRKPHSTASSQFTAVRDEAKEYKGTDGDVEFEFDATRRAYQTSKKGNFVDQDGADCSDRIVLVEKFRKLPGINNDLDTFTASVTAAEMLLAMNANPDFEVSGVNSTTALATFDADGGILLTTAGADGDEMIVGPQTSTRQSVWNALQLKPSAGSRFECLIKTQASVAKTIIWAGLKLTGAEAKTTDDDSVYFRYEDDVNGAAFEICTSIATVDAVIDTAVLLAPDVAADTFYHLSIEIQSDRTAKCYINGLLVGTTGALTAAAALKPWVGVAADGAAPGAKALQVLWIKVSRAAA